MANPEFVFNAVTLAFPHQLTNYTGPKRIHDRSFNPSGGNIIEVVVHRSFFRIGIELARFDNEQFRHDLEAWWTWAGQGNQYAFAFDSADKIDTTLDAAAAAGQKVIPLTSTTSIVVGEKYRIREADDTEQEIIEVASIIAGVSVTAVNNLIFSYASADIFRSRDYFPKVKTADSEFPVTENPGPPTWNLQHTFEQDEGT